MQMRTIHFMLMVMSLSALGVAMSSASEIKLRVRGDLVLKKDMRTLVLEVGENYLLKPGGEPAEVDPSANIFEFEKPKQPDAVPVVETPVGNQEPVVPVQVYNYDDVTVLKIVAESLSSQVTGSIARGDKSFLQLKGGKMVPPGYVFPARLPQIKDKTFNVIIDSVSQQGYTLKLGEATRYVPIKLN